MMYSWFIKVIRVVVFSFGGGGVTKERNQQYDVLPMPYFFLRVEYRVDGGYVTELC
jgi:hypothetical protein